MIRLLKHNTEQGQLLSITDSVAQHDPGEIYEDEDGTKYIYMYNGVGSDCVANNLYWVWYGADATSPYARAIADGQADYGRVGAAMAAIPDTYWGWFVYEGKGPNRIYFDCIDQNATVATTDGHALIISSGVVACTGAALAGDDLTEFAVAAETRSASETVYMRLLPRISLSTA